LLIKFSSSKNLQWITSISVGHQGHLIQIILKIQLKS
jgi:hypothetical protein